MKIAVKPDLRSKTFYEGKSYTLLRQKEQRLINYKSYQKLFVMIISLSTFLIFSESPLELENICMDYYSKKSCNIW